MNICFMIPNMGGGGAERVIARLSKEFINRGHNVSIMMTAGDVSEYELDESIDIIYLTGKTDGNLLKRIGRIGLLRKYMKGHMDTHYIGMETSTNLYALLASFGLGINITVSERIDPRVYGAKGLRSIIYRLFGRRFVFQTEEAKNYFVNEIGERSVIIPNPVSNSLPDPHKGLRDKVVVAVGRLEEQKDYATLLMAFKGFLKRHGDYELHIYGKGSLEEMLKGMVEELGIKGNVSFKGFCDNVWEREKSARMYVLSSLYEGMPNALMEAMAVGMPVISTDSSGGGAGELIESDSNGILIEVGDVQGLAEAMSRLADDDDLCNRLGAKAYSIRDRYSIGKVADMWLEAIK